MATSLELPFVTAPLAYLADSAAPIEHRVYPLSSGIPTVRPPLAYRIMPIHDARALADTLDLDTQGFALTRHPTPFTDFYGDDAVRSQYYPDVAEFVRHTLGASAVFVFDHNTRSAVRAARGEAGVRLPVDAVHNDYTETSGPRRAREILTARGREDLLGHRFAFVNLWRPILGPVQDVPLALCDARTVTPADIVDTPIHHYVESDLTTPSHSGEIQSLRYAAAHRWFYVSDMQPPEVLLLKCYDVPAGGRARFMPHTGFKHPICPPDFTPRESIEARTLVVY